MLVETDWRSEAVERDFRSVLSIPLVYDETLYGVVSMYSQDSDGFRPALQTVLEELGELLAHATVSKERKEALHSDQTMAIEFDIWDESCLFYQVVTGTDCEIVLDGIVPQSGGSTLVFVRVTAGTAEQVVRQAEQIERIEESRRTEDDTASLVQFKVTEPFIGSILANSEFVLIGHQATRNETHLTIEVPTAADTRQAVTLVKSQFETAQLVSKRQPDTSAETQDLLRGNVLECLTNRQREVVETAYQVGYFESPRQVNGAEVAGMFGFSDTAFHQHLRDAQSRLFGELLSTPSGSLPPVESPDIR